MRMENGPGNNRLNHDTKKRRGKEISSRKKGSNYSEGRNILGRLNHEDGKKMKRHKRGKEHLGSGKRGTSSSTPGEKGGGVAGRPQ